MTGKFSKGNVSGSALFFSLSSSDKGNLVGHEVKDTRVRPSERHSKLHGYTNSGPLYVECRNYFAFPRTFKGAVCAIKTKKNNRVWKFGLINRSIKGQILEIFIWKGRQETKTFSAESSMFNRYPSFFSGVTKI